MHIHSYFITNNQNMHEIMGCGSFHPHKEKPEIADISGFKAVYSPLINGL